MYNLSTLPLMGIATIVVPIICIIVTLVVNFRHVRKELDGTPPAKAHKPVKQI